MQIFLKDGSCCKQIFNLKTIIEQCVELQEPLFLNLKDYKLSIQGLTLENSSTLWCSILNLKTIYEDSECFIKTQVLKGNQAWCVLSTDLPMR